MIDERYIELMNDEIEGHNTPAQSESLRDYLESDPEARRVFTELQQSADLITESVDVAPPADMPQRIMDLVADRDAREAALPAWHAKGERVRRHRFGSYFQPVPAWAFAAGLVLGLLAFAAFDLMRRGEPSLDQLRGDMAVPARSDADLRGSPWWVDGAGFNGTVSARSGSGRVVLHIVGTAATSTRFVLLYDGEAQGVAYDNLAGPAGSLDSEAGRVTLALSGTGEHAFVLVGYAFGSAPLTLRIESPAARIEHVFGPGPP